MNELTSDTSLPAKLFISWGVPEKLIFGVHMGIYGTQLLYFIEKYIFNDWDFLVSLSLLVVFDTVLGIKIALNQGVFKVKKGLNGFATKVIVLACTIASIGIIDNSKIGGQTSWFEGYIDAGAFAIMLGFEGISVLRNLYILKPTPLIEQMLQKLDLLIKNSKDKTTDQ